MNPSNVGVASASVPYYTVALFFHPRNAVAAERMSARLAAERAPGGLPYYCAKADAYVFSGVADVDHGTHILLLDKAIHEERSLMILQSHRDAALKDLEVHYVSVDANGMFDFVAPETANAPATDQPVVVAVPQATIPITDTASTGTGDLPSGTELFRGRRRGGGAAPSRSEEGQP